VLVFGVFFWVFVCVFCFVFGFCRLLFVLHGDSSTVQVSNSQLLLVKKSAST